MAENKGGNEDQIEEKGKASEAEEKPKRKSAYRLQDEPQAPAEASEAPEEPAAAPDEATQEGEPEAQPEDAGLGALFQGDIVEGLKETFRRYVLTTVAKPEEQQETVNVNLDLDFLKEHAAPLISTMFQSVAKSVLPEKFELPLGKKTKEAEPPVEQAGEEVEGEEAAAEAVDETSQRDVEVAVNFDFGEFLKSLLKPRPTAPSEETPQAEGEDEEE